MDAAGLTESLRSGDEEGIALLFDRFAPGLHDYCLTLQDRPEPAAEAVRNTLLAAIDKVGQLADPERIEVWLFALARNECLRTTRREQAATASPTTTLARITGVYQRLRHPAEQELREVSTLVQRYGLDHRGVAAVYGIPRWRAKSLAARADDRLSTLPPAAELPTDLRERFLTDAVVGSRAAYRGELAGPYRRRSGFPVPLDRVGATQRNVLVAAAVVVVVTFALLTTLPFGARDEVALTAGKPNAAPLEPLVPTGSASLSPSGSLSPTSPAATKSPTPRPSRSTAPPTVPTPQKRNPDARFPAIVGADGLCAEVIRTSEVEVRNCDGSDEQRWSAPGDGTIRANGKCLDLADGETDSGTRIDLQACDGSGSQRWRAGPNGSLVNDRTDKCMDGPNNASNPRFLQIFGCNGEFYQRWSLP